MKFFKSLLPTMAMLGLVLSLGACSDKDKNEAASTHYTIDLDSENPVLPEYLKTGDTITIENANGTVQLKLKCQAESSTLIGSQEEKSSALSVKVSDDKRTFGVDKLVSLPEGLWICEASVGKKHGYQFTTQAEAAEMHVEIIAMEEDVAEEDEAEDVAEEAAPETDEVVVEEEVEVNFPKTKKQ